MLAVVRHDYQVEAGISLQRVNFGNGAGGEGIKTRRTFPPLGLVLLAFFLASAASAMT
jgi:hypothetical protein